MGLINPDEHVTSAGITKTNTYISFNNETIYLRQAGTNELGEKVYSVNANYRIFWDIDAKNAGKSFIELRSVATTITATELTGNLYEILYTQLKLEYPNAVDEPTL